MKSENLRFHLLGILTSFFIATGFIINKFGLNQNIHPITFATFRTTLSSILLFLLSIKFGKIYGVKDINTKFRKLLVISGVLGAGIPFITIYYGIKLTSLINAGFLSKIDPIYILPISYFFLNEKFTRKQLLSCFVMLLGVFLLTTKGHITPISLGDLLIIIIPLLWAISNTLLKSPLKRVDPYNVGWIKNLSGSPFLIFVQLIFISSLRLNLSMIWIVASALSFPTFSILLNYSIKYLGVGLTTIYSLLSAVFTTIGGIVFFNEQIILMQMLGGLMILIGGYVIFSEKAIIS